MSAESSPSPGEMPECIELDHRFATRVMPDVEEVAELEAQDRCEEEINGERCYFRLSNPCATPCQYQYAQAKGLAVLLTRVTFEQMIKPLEDDAAN